MVDAEDYFEGDSSLIVEQIGSWMKEDSFLVSKVGDLSPSVTFGSYPDLPANTDGVDSNIKFHQRSDKISIASTRSEEFDSESDESLPKIDLEVTPFSLIWSFGVNISVPFINLTKKNEHLVFYAAAHNGVLYDYASQKMELFRGHQNSITSMAIEHSGKYLATADSGPENSIIVWNLESKNPVRTIFHANPESGTKILQMSCGGKYIISISDEVQAAIRFWLWTEVDDTPQDSYTQRKSFGQAITAAFNPNIQEHFVVAFEKVCVFFQWDAEQRSLSEPYIPEIRKHKAIGVITDCTYVCECNECMASTSDGCILVFGNALNVVPYELEPESNRKRFVKTVKISTHEITCLKYVDGFLVLTDVRGFITFFDKQLKLLYWCNHFELPAINHISFNMEPRKYKFENPLDLNDSHFNIPSPRKILDDSKFLDLSEEYEILYKSLVPSDATINRSPFIVRDFFVSTVDGNLIKIDYMANSFEYLFNVIDSDVATIEVHDEKPYLMIAYKRGRISLYNYETHLQLTTTVLPEAIDDVEKGEFEFFEEETKPSYVEITCLKYSYQCFYLAVGRSNGEVWFLDPIMFQPQLEEPLRPTKHAIKRMCYSKDSKYFAFYDDNHTVFLCVNINRKWEFSGKIRSHYRTITDIMFTSVEPYELYTIGKDRHIINYNLEPEEEGLLSIKTRHKTDQSSVCNTFVEYSLSTSDELYFLVADDQHKLKILDKETNAYRHIFLGPSLGCFSRSPINQLKIIACEGEEYLMFCNTRHIGVLILPPDGNPYKYTGTIAHPQKILNFCIDKEGQYMFTCGENDLCVLMWKIDIEAVENLYQAGGQELSPFYCLLEGGGNGWLFSEMQNLFYYMQILHQGQDSVLPRNVTDRIALTELPDLMRACGFYPSEYEIEIMLNDVRNQNFDNNSEHPEEISFVDFVKLYINHRPVHGVSMDKLEDAFANFLRLSEYGAGEVNAEEFINIICERGEKLSREAAHRCLLILMHYDTTESEEADDDFGLNFSFLPQEIDFDTFADDILGIDMERNQTSEDSLRRTGSSFFNV